MMIVKNVGPDYVYVGFSYQWVTDEWQIPAEVSKWIREQNIKLEIDGGGMYLRDQDAIAFRLKFGEL